MRHECSPSKTDSFAFPALQNADTPTPGVKYLGLEGHFYPVIYMNINKLVHY
jgi:hypothetical protein